MLPLLQPLKRPKSRSGDCNLRKDDPSRRKRAEVTSARKTPVQGVVVTSREPHQAADLQRVPSVTVAERRPKPITMGKGTPLPENPRIKLHFISWRILMNRQTGSQATRRLPQSGSFEHLVLSVLTLGHPIDAQHLPSQRDTRKAIASLQKRGWAIERMVTGSPREHELYRLANLPSVRDPITGALAAVQLHPASFDDGPTESGKRYE